MERDMDLIRLILMQIEKDYRSTAIHGLKIDGYDKETVAYHCKILSEAGLISAYKGHYASNELYNFSVGSLTWAGHDYLEKVRDNTRWAKIKGIIKDKALPITIEVVKMLADGLISAAMGSAINGL